MSLERLPAETSQRIGERIRAVRSEAGLSQEQLANLIHRRQATISGWESGRRLPSLEDLYDLAYVLDRDVYEFLPRRRLEPPLRGLLRAIREQFPVGTRFRAALELFLKSVGAVAPPAKEFGDLGSDPGGAAANLIQAAGVTNPPVEVVTLARRCGVRVAGWEGMDDAISGILVQLDDGPVIAFNAAHPVERQRFTVAHELGHLLLGHLKEFHIDLSGPIDSHSRPGYSRSHERGANEFAANLLMPETWIRERIDGEPLEALASRTFEVSELAFGYRLMNLGIKASSEGPQV